MSTKIWTWNVNGIRAAYPKGLGAVLAHENKAAPDILCLQEVKATFAEYPKPLLEQKDYVILHADSSSKGQSGVAMLYRSNLKPKWHHLGMDIKKFDQEGRTIITCFENFILMNTYIPNGRRDHSRVEFKLEFSRALLKKALALQQELKLPIIICGDINTAHHPIDLKNPVANKNSTGFLPHERKFLDEMQESGFIDLFRYQHPTLAEAYTWWTFRGDCRKRNIGWRLDYFWVTPDLLALKPKCGLRPDIMGSDHCPVELTLP
ncbi:MAG: exodeoxyribonuclease III [Bdellovibrionales bacterium GWA2_49_15]|nr:MAG: exodeoxyribonuclease III [Bdellovibrionales bacterium GWA2_49_15]HAZ14923.1 exodeoxyribonuclease III [Bdellovibrionales bacterium]